ncbi:MAG TPA: DUF4129 domain-containing protein [Pirellulaceae bacterium]|nr:DUF4129 domain-containing protein [Pirellulaceae bacterium]
MRTIVTGQASRAAVPRVLLLALCALGLAALVGKAWAQDRETDEGVELGREALSKRRYPWYEPGQDVPRPLRVGNKSDTRAENQSTPTKNSAPTGSSSGGGVSLFGSALSVLGLVVLTLVLSGVAALIAWAFLRNETSQTQGASIVAASREVDRVEQLPFTLKRASGDFLADARRLAQEGNYSEAVIYLYSHLLVELDKLHVIRLAKGKTNRQYLRETRPRPVLAGILETTMVAFEDVFFGHYPLPRERFEECIGQVGDFQAELSKLERAAA